MAEWRVLVVDDDTHMLDLMIRRLARMGLQADRAQDGRAAMEIVKQTAYDLILTDIYMPGGTGLEILRKAKENDPHVQVIMVTGSATLDNAVEALNMGAFSYLSKPFDHMSVFDNSVSRALEFRRLIRDNQRMAEIQRRRGDMLEAEVTDRIRQMRRKQQDMVDLLARLPEGVLVVDTEGRVLLSNATAEEWLAREARLDVQPLRRYLSTLTPPRRPTKSETEIDGVFLRLTAQALPPEEGKARILVTIGEAGDEGQDIRRQLTSSVARLKPGLDWLSRQALDEKETDVVRLLLTQVAAIETILGPEAAEGRARRVTEVDWDSIDLEAEDEEVEMEAAAGSGEKPRGGKSKGPKPQQWPPPPASQTNLRAAPERKRAAPPPSPQETEEEKRFGTVLLSEDSPGAGGEAATEGEPLLGPPVAPGELPPVSPAMEAGLERLLQHLAETPVVEESETPAPEAEIPEPEQEIVETPPPPAPEPVEPAPVVEAAPAPARSQGLLGKVRREGKLKATPSAPPPTQDKVSEPTLRVPPTQQRPARPAQKAPEPGKLQRAAVAAKPASIFDIKPGGAAPTGTTPPEPSRVEEHPSGLLGKVRRSLNQGDAREESSLTAGKAPPDRLGPTPESHVPSKDLEELLDAVREAAEASEAEHPDDGPSDWGSKSSSSKRGPVWPPPPPSEQDEE